MVMIIIIIISFRWRENMKVCVSSQGSALDNQVDPRFGRCAFFIYVDTESLEFEAIQNPNIAAMGGAGVQSAQLVAEKGANFVITGNCGPNAYSILNAAGISVITGASGSVKEVVEKVKTGQYESSSGPNVDSHFGMK